MQTDAVLNTLLFPLLLALFLFYSFQLGCFLLCYFDKKRQPLVFSKWALLLPYYGELFPLFQDPRNYVNSIRKNLPKDNQNFYIFSKWRSVLFVNNERDLDKLFALSEKQGSLVEGFKFLPFVAIVFPSQYKFEARRKLIKKGITKRIFNKRLIVMRKEMLKEINNLKEKRSGEIHDVFEFWKERITQIACLLLGDEMLDENKRKALMELYHKIDPEERFRRLTPDKIIKVLLSKLSRQDNEIYSTFGNIILDIIRNRTGRNGVEDFLDALVLEAGGDERTIVDTTFVLFLTLILNTFVCSSYVLYHLHQPQHQQLLEDIKTEIKTLYKKDEPWDAMFRMPLFQNCIYETNRLYSNGIAPRKVVQDTPFCPKNTIACIPYSSCLVDPEFFGSDVYTWNPHRFDNLDKTRASMMYFGFGVHKCVGEQFATAVISLITSELIRNFDWTIVTKEFQTQLQVSTSLAAPIGPVTMAYTLRSEEL